MELSYGVPKMDVDTTKTASGTPLAEVTAYAPGVNVRPHITVVNLWPHESECVVCGLALFGCKQGIPMYEGIAVPYDWQGDWAGFDACNECFEKYERGEMQMWKAHNIPDQLRRELLKTHDAD